MSDAGSRMRRVDLVKRIVVMVDAYDHDPMRSRSVDDDGPSAEKAAIEQIIGHPLPVDWPAAAIPAGARVRVVKDVDWDGPWMREFDGVIDALGAPEPVRHPLAGPDELAYWVRFDEPQLDSAGDGPYRKAQIWGRYLRPV
jgi:hypothetical protein